VRRGSSSRLSWLPCALVGATTALGMAAVAWAWLATAAAAQRQWRAIARRFHGQKEPKEALFPDWFHERVCGDTAVLAELRRLAATVATGLRRVLGQANYATD
jgi:hypothetical protein